MILKEGNTIDGVKITIHDKN